MLFKFKKFYSFILASIVLISAFSFFTGVLAKIKGDCIFSIGPACRPAQWLRKTHKRFQAAPFDWMMKYSLDTVNHCFKTKFADFFECAGDTGEVIGEHRVVKDTKNGIVSMHHFSKHSSLENAKRDIRAKMINRGKKVDRILKNSRSIILIANRQRDSLDDFKRFIHNFSKIYPDRNITLVNIYSNGNNWVSSNVLYTGFAATSKKKAKKKPKLKPKKILKKAPQDVKETKTDSQSESQDVNEIKKSPQNMKHSTKTVKKQNKKQTKKKRKKLRIIQYSFNDNSSSWEGNPAFWQQVMNDIELTGRNFDRNMDFKQVEF